MNRKVFFRRLKQASIGAVMADIALLLLVFFMATTTTEPPQGVEVELPKAKPEPAEQDNIYITVSPEGEIYYEGENIKPEMLRSKLLGRQEETDKLVAITADRGLAYREVRRVLDILQKTGFLNIMFMSEERR